MVPNVLLASFIPGYLYLFFCESSFLSRLDSITRLETVKAENMRQF